MPNPQLIALAMQLQQKNKQRLSNNLKQLPGAATGIGNLLQQISITDDGTSDVGTSVFGGALSGAGAGAALGPLGILGGALLGGAGGLSSAAQSNADFYDTRALSDVFNLSSKTVSPSILGKGGMVLGDEEELTPVQMELSEVYITDDLSIYDSKAKLRHEDMKDEDITDVVKSNSFAFSNRKDFKPSTVADDVLGYGVAKYTEDGSYSLGKIKMSDVFGDSKKPIPFSDAAKLIKNKFKVLREDDPNVDLLTQITNQENKQARAPFANKLIELHEDQYNSKSNVIIPQKYGQGGKVKKYEAGGYMDPLAQILMTLTGQHSSGQPNRNIPVTPNLTQPNLNGVNLKSLTAGVPKLPVTDTTANPYGSALGNIGELMGLNQEDFDQTGQDIGGITSRMRGRSGLSGILDGLAVGMQSTRVDPRLQDTRFTDEMFEEISPAIADQVSGEGFARANSLIANVTRDNPQLAQDMAPRLFDSALDQSNNARLKILESNLSQKRQKYGFLNKAGTFNRTEQIRSEEASRDLINKKRADLTSVGNRMLSREDAIDQNEFTMGRQNKGQFNQNNLKLMQSEMDLLAGSGEFNARTKYNLLLQEYMKKSINK